MREVIFSICVTWASLLRKSIVRTHARFFLPRDDLAVPELGCVTAGVRKPSQIPTVRLRATNFHLSKLFVE
jgi:hypothetical protein